LYTTTQQLSGKAAHAAGSRRAAGRVICDYPWPAGDAQGGNPMFDDLQVIATTSKHRHRWPEDPTH
jgi:hypothetical protein